MYNIMSSTSDNLTSFSKYIPLIDLSFLIVAMRIFNTLLNNRGKCELPCIVTDLKREIFNFSSLSIMSYLILWLMVFIILEKSFISTLMADFIYLLFIHIYFGPYQVTLRAYY